MQNYDHLVQVDEAAREIRIYRVDSSGLRTLFSSVPLPAGGGWNAPVEQLARDLGENLLMDSPSARKLLQI
jgi:hypothetical protein